jgi:hypothetical protein
MNQVIQFCNCNAVGDIVETIFFPILKKELVDLEEGPKQSSPDFYGMNKEYEFELKVFMKNPGFDIGNFVSYINQLCEIDGVYRKIYKTKYLIFEYFINDDQIIIKKFHYLNVYNLVSYIGKYPISMQVKKNNWYNIRPDNVNNWYNEDKTPHKFIENIIKCINLCPNMNDIEKIKYIDSITLQFDKLKSKYTL